MIIDRALYLLVPKFIHRWAAENRAKVRAYALGVAAPIVIAITETYVPEQWQTVVTSALISAGAYGVGRGTHAVVTPWDQDA